MTNLITKYRPETLADVVGQNAIVKSLSKIVQKKDTQTFLFSGPSGCGKTTLSIIVAKNYGVEDSSIMEIDAASKTGIDDMRALQDTVQYRPFGLTGKRAIILDECHALSRSAFDSLLKILEEPPPHVVWFFCTTNLNKIPNTIKTRCTKFELKEVSSEDLEKLLDYVCGEEKLDIGDDVFSLIVKEAKGSPRELISLLVVARTAKNKKEAAELIRSSIETDASLELCRYIVEGNGSWTKCMSLLEKLKDENPESIRIGIFNYLAVCLKNAKSDEAAVKFITKLDSFSVPYVGIEGQAPLLLSIGRALFAE
jgi:DNA polymerase III subunit gamma/tau